MPTVLQTNLTSSRLCPRYNSALGTSFKRAGSGYQKELNIIPQVQWQRPSVGGRCRPQRFTTCHLHNRLRFTVDSEELVNFRSFTNQLLRRLHFRRLLLRQDGSVNPRNPAMHTSFTFSTCRRLFSSQEDSLNPTAIRNKDLYRSHHLLQTTVYPRDSQKWPLPPSSPAAGCCQGRKTLSTYKTPPSPFAGRCRPQRSTKECLHHLHCRPQATVDSGRRCRLPKLHNQTPPPSSPFAGCRRGRTTLWTYQAPKRRSPPPPRPGARLLSQIRFTNEYLHHRSKVAVDPRVSYMNTSTTGRMLSRQEDFVSHARL